MPTTKPTQPQNEEEKAEDLDLPINRILSSKAVLASLLHTSVPDFSNTPVRTILDDYLNEISIYLKGKIIAESSQKLGECNEALPDINYDAYFAVRTPMASNLLIGVTIQGQGDATSNRRELAETLSAYINQVANPNINPNENPLDRSPADYDDYCEVFSIYINFNDAVVAEGNSICVSALTGDLPTIPDKNGEVILGASPGKKGEPFEGGIVNIININLDPKDPDHPFSLTKLLNILLFSDTDENVRENEWVLAYLKDNNISVDDLF